LTRYKSKTELFGKNCEKLYHEKSLHNLSEQNVMEYISSVIVARNDLLNSDILSGFFVNDFRCYEWTLNVLCVQKGFIAFLTEESQISGAFDKFLKGFNSRKSLLYKQIINENKLFRDLYHEGRSMEKLFETSRFYNRLLLEEMNLTIQTLERIKGQVSLLKLKENQFQDNFGNIMKVLEKNRNYRITLKTQRTLLLKVKDIELLIREIIDIKINSEEEYGLLISFKNEALGIVKEINAFKKKIRNSLGKSNSYRINYEDIEDLTGRIIVFPVNLEENEDFMILLYISCQYFLEKLQDFPKKSRNQKEREEYMKLFALQYDKLPISIDESDLFVKAFKFLKESGLSLKKNPENSDNFLSFYDKTSKFLKKINKEIKRKQFLSLEFLLVKYDILLILMKEALKTTEQRKAIKFQHLQHIIKETQDFIEESPEEIKKQKDFQEFFELSQKIQQFFKEIGLELKKKAYGMKSIENNGSELKIEEFLHKNVELTDELMKVLNSNEQEFINYFEPFDTIIEIKKEFDHIKIEIEENNGNNGIKSENIDFSPQKESFCEEYEKYFEEYVKNLTKNLGNNQEEIIIRQEIDNESDDQEDISIDEEI